MLLDTDQLVTRLYFNHGHQPCSMKILWKSPTVKFESMTFPKGQKISEGNSGIYNSPKTKKNIIPISAFASRKWSNYKNKGT